jgi:hypothetical protein
MENKTFYIKVIGYKKGPIHYGPYDKEEWDPEKTLKEFRAGMERGFQAELR